MKLLPKARPVQINKLKLKGVEINSIDDLKEHFYVKEIIELGKKFVLWLNRNEETRKYSSRVNEIFINKKERSTCALSLISTFFDHPALSLIKEIDNFHMSHSNEKILSSILECLEPTESNAKELLEKYGKEKWLMTWLVQIATLSNLSVDFKYSLGTALWNSYPKIAQKLIIESNEKDYEKESIKDPENPDILNIEIREKIITLKKVKSQGGSFYITTNEIPAYHLCTYLGIEQYFGSNENSSQDNSKRTTKEFEEILERLKKVTGYTWDFPSTKEWKKAFYAQALIQKKPSGRELGKEWCKDLIQGNKTWFWIVSPTNCDKAKSNRCSYLLHPVIRIKDNPKLQ